MRHTVHLCCEFLVTSYYRFTYLLTCVHINSVSGNYTLRYQVVRLQALCNRPVMGRISNLSIWNCDLESFFDLWFWFQILRILLILILIANHILVDFVVGLLFWNPNHLMEAKLFISQANQLPVPASTTSKSKQWTFFLPAIKLCQRICGLPGGGDLARYK